jgi:hypothetical protein
MLLMEAARGRHDADTRPKSKVQEQQSSHHDGVLLSYDLA